jgi:serine/threonine protein kinase
MTNSTSSFQEGNFPLFNDQYLFINPIAKDYYGTLWKTFDFKSRKYAWIKEFSPTHCSIEYINELIKEHENVRQQNNKQALCIENVWESPGNQFYALITDTPGITLEFFIRKCNLLEYRIPWQITLYIVQNILKTLIALNKAGTPHHTIIYRNLSPRNIFLSSGGKVFLGPLEVDAFIYKPSSSDELILLKKYAYMSPEQLKNDLLIDQRSDIFLLGIVLYELLTGFSLYTGESLDDVKHQVLQSPFHAAYLTQQDIPEEIADMVAQALQRDPEKRYQSAMEMFGDVRRLLKWKDDEKLGFELSQCIVRNFSEELKTEETEQEQLREMTLKSFISKNTVEKRNAQLYAPATSAIQRESKRAFLTGKGRTVFEAAGDWLTKEEHSHKAFILKMLGACLCALLLFAAADGWFQLTSFGKMVHTHIFPPHVLVASFPPGATISISTREGGIILPDTPAETPIPLRKISPRTYLINAHLAGFQPVSTVATIMQRTKKTKQKPQHVSVLFNWPVQINSVPPEADIVIDGTRYSVTPCLAQLAAGPLTISLAYTGFQTIGSLSKEPRESQCCLDLTTLDDAVIFRDIDKNFWEYSSSMAGTLRQLTITGYLLKEISIDSEPQDMQLSIQALNIDTHTPAHFALRAGRYEITISDRYKEYITRNITLDISSSTPSEMIINMKKPVRAVIKY